MSKRFYAFKIQKRNLRKHFWAIARGEGKKVGSGRTAKPHGRLPEEEEGRLPKEEEGPDGWAPPVSHQRERGEGKALAGWLGLSPGREGEARGEVGPERPRGEEGEREIPFSFFFKIHFSTCIFFQMNF